MDQTREVLDGLVIVVLLLVGIVAGAVLEQRWAVMEARVATFEKRVEMIEALYGPAN